jgi:predicted GTPase
VHTGGDCLGLVSRALDHDLVMDVGDNAVELAQGLAQDVVGGGLHDILAIVNDQGVAIDAHNHELTTRTAIYEIENFLVASGLLISN